MSLGKKIKAGVLSFIMAVGSFLPVAFPTIINAQEARPVLNVAVKGSGSVWLNEGENETRTEITQTFPYNMVVTPGSSIMLECSGDTLVVQEIDFNGEILDLDYSSKNISYEFQMPKDDTDIQVVFGPDESNSEELNLPSDRQFELNDEEMAAIEQYQSDDYETSRPIREKMVKKYGLKDYVDEEYFLTQSFFDDYGVYGATCGGMMILNPKARADFKPESADISLLANGNVSNFIEHFWYYSGGFMSAGTWDVTAPGLGTNLAFCAHGIWAPPTNNTVTDIPTIQNNENMRKALYYGYNGPQNKLGRYSQAQQIIFTSDLVSMANIGTCISKEIGGGWIWDGYVASLWNQLQSWPSPPANYKAYLANTYGSGINWQGITTPYQPLAFGRFEETGHLAIVKRSSNPEMVNGNNCYSLLGAEYTLYSDSNCTNVVRVFRLKDGNGSSQVYDGPYETKFGTYYLKETKAAPGYALDPTIHTVKVEANGQFHPGGMPNWLDFIVEDKPQSAPASLLLKKVDSQTGLNKPQGQGSLSGAEFTFRFYAGEKPNLNGPATRTWIMKTDTNGEIRLQDSYKVSGDAFYKNSAGAPAIPLGTVTVQETKAPEGYFLNDQIQVIRITGGGTGEHVSSYSVPTLKEQVNELILSKKQLGTNTAIPETVFIWTKPDGSITELKTDNSGQIRLIGMTNGTHKLKEKEAMPGYELNPNEFVFEVNSSGIVSKTTLDGKDMAFNQGTVSGKAAELIVYDKPSDYDLKLIKVNEKDKQLPGAEFTLYEDENCTKPIATKVTDSSGVITFNEIKDRTNYWFKETKAPEGYRIPVDSNGKQQIYKLYAESNSAQATFDFYVNNTKYTVANTTGGVHLEDQNGRKVVSITVVNYTTSKLPDTGSNGTLILLGVGLTAFACWIALNKKKN